MSHSVKITLIADQEIKFLGEDVNIYNIDAIVLDENGKIIDYLLKEHKVKNVPLSEDTIREMWLSGERTINDSDYQQSLVKKE